MNLFKKIRDHFSKDWIETPDFSWNNYEIQFELLEDEHLVEIASMCRMKLTNEEVYNNKNDLKVAESIICKSLDSLMPVVKQIWETDYFDTQKESSEKGWVFRYYADFDKRTNRISINNVLTAADGSIGNVIYSLIVIKKIKNQYYCWDLLE